MQNGDTRSEQKTGGVEIFPGSEKDGQDQK